MAKLRGGQLKHWAEKARVQAWYAEVKKRCGWSDYLLDYEFAWTEEGYCCRTTTCRPRAFEWIRKNSRKPQGRDRRWRNMEALVVAVEENPLFKGTQALYQAEIWDLFQDASPRAEVVQKRIERLLKSNQLVRVPVEAALAREGNLIQELDPPVLFERCLRLSLSQMDRFSRIALVWSLYLQTEPANNARYRTAVEMIIDRLLDQFFADFLPSWHYDCYQNAIRVLLTMRLDLSSSRASGYGFIESIGTWAVVPEELLGKLTEKHLIPEQAFFAALTDSR